MTLSYSRIYCLKASISDTIAVTNYLRNRFDKEKYMLWVILGGAHCTTQPELFYAYIGIGQVAQQDRSERLAYTYMLEEFCKRN